MANYPTTSQSFGLELAKFAEKAKEAPNKVVRKISQQLLTNVVMRTPVGNPDVWAVNNTAVDYNNAVSEWNAGLRADPANLTKAGRLKRGLKVNDGMDVVAPDGYVGGRLRANWFVSVGADNETTIDKVDKSGKETIARGVNTLNASDTTKGVYIKNNLPYAIPVEYGHSQQQAPQGMVRVTIAEIQTYVNAAVAEVAKE